MSHSGKQTKQGNIVVKSIARNTIMLSNGTHCLSWAYVHVFPRFLCPIHDYWNQITIRSATDTYIYILDSRLLWSKTCLGSGIQPQIHWIWGRFSLWLNQLLGLKGTASSSKWGLFKQGWLWVLHSAPPGMREKGKQGPWMWLGTGSRGEQGPRDDSWRCKTLVSQRMWIPSPRMMCLVPVEAGSVLARRGNTLSPSNIPLSCSLCGHADLVISCLWWLLANPTPCRQWVPEGSLSGMLGCGNQEGSAVSPGMAAPVSPLEPFSQGQQRDRC